MKLEVGMYVRIEKGIYKINDYINNNYTQKYTYIDNKGVSNIYKDTKEIIKVDYEWGFLENKYYKNSTYRIQDLIDDGLIEKVD